MRSTKQLRTVWAKPCDRDLSMFAFQSGAKAHVATETTDAWRALDQVMQRHRYEPRSNDTGGYNCRAITGGTDYSLHAYGIAVDVNWSTNPYRKDGRLVTDMKPEMIADIKAIKSLGGASVFRWGGDYSGAKDAMHFEVVASPAELATGIDWASVNAPRPRKDQPGSFAVLQGGDSGPTIGKLRSLLIAAGFDPGPDSDVYNDAAVAAVLAYQASRKLDIDGVVGAQTWTALLTGQPEVALGDSPVKTATRNEPATMPTVRLGVKGDVVLELQKQLAAAGVDPGGADGVFGPLTDAAVRAFQAAHLLEVDGICGPNTWAALAKAAVE